MIRLTMAWAVLLISLFPGSARAADDVAVIDLITESASYDGEEVGEISVRGELVGDFQRRGDHVWVQLNDDPYVAAPLLAAGSGAGANVGIGVRIDTDQFNALGVTAPGGYRVRGPIVRVTGSWRHHDDARGGESYFDAEAVELIESEIWLEEGVRWPAVVGGAALLLVAVAWVIVRRES